MLDRDDIYLNSKEVAQILDISPDTSTSLHASTCCPLSSRGDSGGSKTGHHVIPAAAAWRDSRLRTRSFDHREFIHGVPKGSSPSAFVVGEGGRMVDQRNGGRSGSSDPHRSKIYAEFSHLYDKIFQRIFFPRIARVIQSLNIEPGARVLEVGVGTGLSLSAYPPHCEVVGIDLARDMLDQAAEKDSRSWMAKHHVAPDGRTESQFSRR